MVVYYEKRYRILRIKHIECENSVLGIFCWCGLNFNRDLMLNEEEQKVMDDKIKTMWMWNKVYKHCELYGYTTALKERDEARLAADQLLFLDASSMKASETAVCQLQLQQTETDVKSQGETPKATDQRRVLLTLMAPNKVLTWLGSQVIKRSGWRKKLKEPKI